MSERYTRLFALPKNLYSEGSPVVISAGALLKDNQTDRVLVQLKIKSISDKIIKAIRVSITQFDVAGVVIDEPVNQEMLDFSVERNSEFGQKTAIKLPNSSTRSFSVAVTEVIFSDNSIWKTDVVEWKSVIKPQTVYGYFENDSELLKQYKLDYNVTGKNMFAEDRDLWICSCGNINRLGEDKCYGCGCLYETLKNFTKEALVQSANERVEAEKRAEEERRLEFERKKEEARQKAERKRQEQKAKRKKALKITSIIASVVVICIAIWFATVNSFIPMAKYNSAEKKFQNGEYDTAIATFIELGDFIDSKDRILEVKYAKACALSDNENYKEAADLFSQIQDYNDSKDKRYENLYNYVLALEEEEKYSDAIEICDLIISRNGPYYKDILELKDECLLNAAKIAYSEKQYKSTIEYLSKMSNLDKKSELYQSSKFKYALVNAENKAYFTAFTTLKELDKDGYKKAKEEIYKTGKLALKNKSFEDAVKIFEYLEIYKDSKSQLDAAKYGYVKKHNDNDNETTYEYLKYLKKKNYKDSGKIYEDLYSWKITLLSDYDKKNPIPNYTYSSFELEFKLTGGTPGEEIDIYNKTKWPYGTKHKSSWTWDNRSSGDYLGIKWEDGISSSDGTFLIEFYNADTDEYLGKITIPVGN